MLEMNKNIYISARDVAENAKLNHEISEELRKFKTNHQLSSSGLTRGSRSNKDSLATWILRSHPQGGARMTVERKFWMPYRKGCALRGMTMLFLLACFPSFAQAEQCTPTPDCKSLGYTETSCPDGGVKCPWNTSLMYCCKKCEDKPQTGLIGDFFYCEGQIVGIRVPGQSFAIAMNDAPSIMDWNDANSYSTGYHFCRTSYGRLPTDDELLAIYNNITYLQEQLQKNGGQQFTNDDYWSSFFNGIYNGNYSYYIVVDPVSGSTLDDSSDSSYHVRPVLEF